MCAWVKIATSAWWLLWEDGHCDDVIPAPSLKKPQSDQDGSLRKLEQIHRARDFFRCTKKMNLHELPSVCPLPNPLFIRY